MLSLRSWIACWVVLLLTSCVGNKPHAMVKEFPEGDPVFHREDAGIILPEAPREPARPIILPRGQKERDGLMISFRLSTPTVRAGELLDVTCSVRNTTSVSKILTYPTAQRFDLVVFRDEKQREPVHLWSEGQFFAELYEQYTLGGGTTLTRVLDVQTTNDRTLADAVETQDLSAPLLPGVYYLWARHVGEPLLVDGPVRFEVVE